MITSRVPQRLPDGKPLPIHRIVWLFALLGGTVVAADADRRLLPLVLSDGQRDDAAVVGWQPDQAAWRFQSQRDGAVSVPQSQLVRFGAYRPGDAASAVLLVDDSLLIGRIAQLDAQRCTVEGRFFQGTVDLSVVRAILLNAPPQDGIRDAVIQLARGATGTDDRLILIDGSQPSGTLTAQSLAALAAPAGPTVVRLEVAGQTFSTPLARVRGVVLSPVLRADGVPPGADDSTFWLGLADGSLLRCLPPPALSASSVGGKLPLACGASLTAPAGAALMEAIELLAPAAAAEGLLTGQPPLRFRHIPFFGPSQPLVRWDGEPLLAAEVAGRRYPHGLAMRTAARAVYASGGAARLVAAVAVAGPPQPVAAGFTGVASPDGTAGWPWGGARLAANPAIRFSVLTVDASGVVAERWRSPLIRPGDPPLPIEVDLAGATAVVLAVDPADAGDVADRAVWLDPMWISPQGR